MRRKVVLPILLIALIAGTAFLSLGQLAVSEEGSAPSKEVRSEEISASCGEYPAYAVWKESNGQKYLFIIADDYYALGTLEGEELAYQIVYLKQVIQMLAGSFGVPYEALVYMSMGYEGYIPDDYKQEMLGMADAIEGIEYSDILLQNCFLDLYYGQIIPALSGYPQPPLEIGCTLVARNNGILDITVGQNFDFSQIMHPSLSFVLHKLPGKPLIFSMRMGGMLQLPMGKTSRGIISVVSVVETIVVGSIDTPSAVKCRIAFEEARTAEQLVEMTTSTGITASYCQIVADRRNNVAATENIPNAVAIEEVGRGEYQVRANTYDTPQFRPFLIDQNYSRARKAKTEELVESDRGRLTARDLMEILRYRDGTDADICRIGSPDPTASQTGAFLVTRFCLTYFGLGNLVQNEAGLAPI